MSSIDTNAMLLAMGQMADALGDADLVRAAAVADWRNRRAKLDVLIADHRVEELPDGRLRYNLTTPVDLPGAGGIKVDCLTFNKPTVGTVRAGAKFEGAEWGAFMVKHLAQEIPSDAVLNSIDASEWDDIVEVVSFPFAPPPPRHDGQIPSAATGLAGSGVA